MAKLQSKQGALNHGRALAPLSANAVKEQRDEAHGKEAPKTPTKNPKKDRKKNLPSTPPIRLHDHKRGIEYERGAILGEGGFARCYEVLADGKIWAAKTVSKKSLASDKMRVKFFGEIQVHKGMNHPNIVKFKECFEDKTNIYMILELCSNRSLMDLIRRRKCFSEPEARFFMLQILGAVKYMHSRNVIHRDLKLGNIFLDENMNVKIGDFGLAALLVDGTERKKTICGTPNYIAPEILFGKEDGHSFEVDLWSVGIILYAMLVGKPPFQSSNVELIYDKIKVSAYTYPATAPQPVSMEAKDLISRLLSPNPNERPTIDQIADHPFFTCGYFPTRLTTQSLEAEPRWRTTATEQEWYQNYMAAALTAGVGKDVEGVGQDRGKGMGVLPVPECDSSADNLVVKPNGKAVVAPAVMVPSSKPPGSHKKERRHMLPEELSPKVTKVKSMMMKKKTRVPSALGPLRELQQQAQPVVPSSTSSGTDQVKPMRVTRSTSSRQTNNNNNAPIRRRDVDKENENAGVDLRKEMARGERAPADSKFVKPKLPQAVRASSYQVPQTEENAARPLLRSKTTGNIPQASVPASLSKIREASNAKDLDSIRGGYKVKNSSMSSLTRSSVLTSVSTTLTTLTAFFKDNIEALPPMPAQTKEAISRSSKHIRVAAADYRGDVWANKWVDYSNKCGLGYTLSDGSAGTLFIDGSNVIVSPEHEGEGRYLEYITPKSNSKSGLPLSELPNVEIPGLHSKYEQWKKFSDYMSDNLGVHVEKDQDASSQGNKPTEARNNQFITHFARLEGATMFRFDNGGFQFNFSDHRKLLLHHGGRTLRYVDDNKIFYTFSIEEVYALLSAPPRKTGISALLHKGNLLDKLDIVKDILETWWFDSGLNGAWLKKGKAARGMAGNVIVAVGDSSK